MNRRHDESRNSRLERKKEEIARRLRPVCASFNESEFEQLVLRMATIEIKYAMRGMAEWVDEARHRSGQAS